MKAYLVFKASAWDPGDYIVTVRPSWERPWRDAPIGMTLSMRDAKIVAAWLPTAIREIETIIKNGYEEVDDVPGR